jgi:hypothetical protein
LKNNQKHTPKQTLKGTFQESCCLTEINLKQEIAESFASLIARKLRELLFNRNKPKTRDSDTYG